MKGRCFKRGSLIIAMLAILLILPSCKFGKAINKVNDGCPVLLMEGVFLKGAESVNDGKSVQLTISINTMMHDVEGMNDEDWSEVMSVIKGLLNNNPACQELFTVAREDNKFITYKIISENGTYLYTYPSVVSTYKPYTPATNYNN